jgi:hypothetical protein
MEAAFEIPPSNNNIALYEPVGDRELSLLGRAVKWLRAPDETDAIKGAMKALAIFLSIILSCTVVGIIPVVFGALEWEVQNAQNIVVEEVESVSSAKADIDIEQFDTFQFTKVDKDEILGKQDQIVSVNAKYEKVSLEELDRYDLLPTNKMVVGDVTYYCSDIFMLDTHYVSIALVEINGELFPRLVYHSNSQGTWRVMPSATKGQVYDMFGPMGGRVIQHYGKGQCESDTQLPIMVICALNGLSISTAYRNAYHAGNIVQTIDMSKETKFLKAVQIDRSVFLDEGAKKNFYKKGMIVPFPENPKEIHMSKDENLHPNSLKL